MKYLDKLPLGLLVVLLGAVLFIPFLGNVHLFDWDEINFAESAREMLATGNFWQVQIDYQLFTEKPPFFIWMQALSMHFFGVNEFAARLPNAVIGIITFFALFKVGTALRDKAFGVLWVLVYASCFLPHLYFKSGIIDPTFNLFIFLGIYFFSKLTENYEFADKKSKSKKRNRAAVLTGFFIGLAVLTKGPVGLLLFILTFLFVFIRNRFKKTNSIGEFFLVIASFSLVALAWYGVDFYNNGPAFFSGFIERHIAMLTTGDAGHSGPVYYHFLVLLFGCFPASVFMFGGIKKHDFANGLLSNFQGWMVALVVMVLLVFSLVQTKIIHYSSLSYFPITFFATYFIYFLLKGKRKWKWYHATLFLIIGILWGTAIALVPLVGENIEALAGYIKDDFAVANIGALVYWNFWESAYGISYIIALIIASSFFAIKKIRFGITTLLLSTCIIISVVMVLFVPRIELYTQNAAINFYEAKQEEVCYVDVLGFKSYAHLFYTKKSSDLPHKTKEQLLQEYVEVPVYFVCKNIHEEKYLLEYPQLKKIGEKNGFIFLEKTRY